MEETWWWGKFTSPPDEPPFSHVWLQMIITWSIFITLSLLFFHNYIYDMKFIPYFIWKVRKSMEGALRIQKIIGYFMIFLPTSTNHNSLNFWRFWMVQVSKCHSRDLLHAIFFGLEQILGGRPCLDAKHYRSLLKEKLKYL